eukprot:4631146-Amphidinium_carterae.1
MAMGPMDERRLRSLRLPELAALWLDCKSRTGLQHLIGDNFLSSASVFNLVLACAVVSCEPVCPHTCSAGCGHLFSDISTLLVPGVTKNDNSDENSDMNASLDFEFNDCAVLGTSGFKRDSGPTGTSREVINTLLPYSKDSVK